MSRAEAFAKAAEAMVGAPFRLNGRSPATGLDCVGLVAAALERAGLGCAAPSGYRLRNIAIDRFLAYVPSSGFAEATPPVRRADLLLVRPGPAQHHLAIALGGGCFVHAHAGLGRVALHQGPLPWPAIFHWRLRSEA